MAVVARKGAEEAGAILIVVDRLDGTSDLYAPAPQTAFDEAMPAERLFQQRLEAATPDAVSETIAAEVRFDPDVWVVAVEDRDGRAFLDFG